MKWEYAYLRWEGPERYHERMVEFTHRAAWKALDSSAFFPTIRALGDAGWEMFSEKDDQDEPASFYWFKRQLP